MFNDSLVNWMNALAHRKFVNLNFALLGGRVSYLWYRFRYFVLNNLLLMILHLFEFYLLGLFFHGHQFYYLVLLRGTALILKDAWWGALEGLRASIRRFQVENLYEAIPEEVGNWFTLAVVMSVLQLLLGGIFIAVMLHDAGQVRWLYFVVYGAAIIFQLSAEFLVRVLHSGIYAIQRVYRPTWTIFFAELVSFVIIVSLWSWERVWALPIAYVASSIISFVFTWRYTCESYLSQGISPLFFTPLAQWKIWLKNMPWRRILMASGASAFIGLEGILLWLFQPALMAHQELFKLIFLLSPQINGAFNWGRMAYFDFKKLMRPDILFLTPPFIRALTWLSFFLGFFFWILGVISIKIFLPDISWQVLFFLLPCFLVRSLLALKQIQLFSYDYYKDILWGSSILVLAAIAGYFLETPKDLFCLFFCAILVALILNLRARCLREPIFSREYLSALYALIPKIKKEMRPVSISCFSLTSELTPRARYILLQRLLTQLKGKGEIASLPNAQYFCALWGMQLHEWESYLQLEASGFLSSYKKVLEQKNGALALEKACFLKKIDSYHLNYDLCIPEDQALAIFKKTFSKSLVLTLEELQNLSRIIPKFDAQEARQCIQMLKSLWGARHGVP